MKPVIIIAAIVALVRGSGDECTVQKLTQKILTTRDAAWRPSHRFNEVYPGLVVGEGTNALIHPILKDLQITHVLNCASPSEDDMITRISRQVEYPHEYEEAFNISVYGLPIHDTGSYKVGNLFQEGADFIEHVLTSGGRVYVNSFTGSSRAGTIVVGYFMIKHGYSAVDALHLVRLGREVRPEKGFLEQLCQLEKQLHEAKKATTTGSSPTPAVETVATVTAAPTTEHSTPRRHRMPWEAPQAVRDSVFALFG